MFILLFGNPRRQIVFITLSFYEKKKWFYSLFRKILIMSRVRITLNYSNETTLFIDLI